MNKPQRPTAPPDHRVYPRRPAIPPRPRSGVARAPCGVGASAGFVVTSGPTGPLVPPHRFSLSAMEYRQLGRSGLQVSALTLGTMTFGGGGDFANVGQDRRRRARRARSTSASTRASTCSTPPTSIPAGVSEEIVGEALKAAAATDVLIATKARMPMGDGPNDARPVAPPPDRRLRGQPAAAEAPTTSTSTRCTSGTARRRSRRRWRRWTRWCAPARSAMSAARTTPAGS